MSFSCPLCCCEEYNKEIECVDYTVSKRVFQIVSCKKCGFFQTYPFPSESEISLYYQSQEYISHSDKKSSIFDLIYHLVRKYTLIQKLNLIKNYVSHGTILDYGCGTGYFLETCKKNNFTTYGVEVNDTARQLAKNKNLNVLKDFNELKNLKFDIITLWHVLEHLYNPDHYIKDFYNLLNNNGYLILAVPNKNSYDAQFYQEYWAGYDVPRHLFHFRKKDILMLTRGKYNLVDIQPMFFDAFYVSMLSEKYKNSNLFFLKGFIRGLISNIKAIKNQEYSSLIYVLQKI